MSSDSQEETRDPAASSGDENARPDEVEVPIEASDSPDPETRAAAAELRARNAEEQLAQEHERLLRAAADLDNFRKRAAREREETQKFGNERLLKDLVPVLDNLDRALASASQESGSLADGVRLTRRMFEEALARHGVTVESALGKPFDPRRDEALAQVPDPAAEPGTVVSEHGRAVFLNGRLVRPAMVAVAVAAPQSSGAGGDATGDGG